jgi:hypothetical protein
MYYRIEEALVAPDAARAMDLLSDACRWTCSFSASRDELALVAPRILQAFAQRGREAPHEGFCHLRDFIGSLSTLKAIGATVIPPQLLARLIDDLILPAVEKTGKLPDAIKVCTTLLKAKHDDISILYRLASLLLDRAIGHKLSLYPDECIDLIKAIPDPQTQMALAERVVTSIAAMPDPERRLMGCSMTLAGLFTKHGRDQAAGMHLGKLLLRATAPDVLFTNDKSLPLSDVITAFRHPAIPANDKRMAAAQVAVAVERCALRNPIGAGELVVGAAPFMTQAEKTASAYRLRQLNFPLKQVDFEVAFRISAISELVAGTDDDDACRSMQDFLRAECARYIDSGPEFCKGILLAECIRLDPAGGLNFLADLLARVPAPHLHWDGDLCNLVAIATFQADPEGEAYVPGSEVVDIEKNPLSDSYIDRGTKYEYPAWLASRRAELLAFSLRSSGRATAQIYEGIPRNILGLARISQEYSGISVKPSDWPALREHLRTQFPHQKS